MDKNKIKEAAKHTMWAIGAVATLAALTAIEQHAQQLGFAASVTLIAATVCLALVGAKAVNRDMETKSPGRAAEAKKELKTKN